MTLAKFTVNTVDTAAFLTDQLNPQNGASTLDSVSLIARYMDGLANGAFYFNTIAEEIGTLNSTATLTMTGAATAAQTLSVANVTFTAETSGATGNQYNLSSTPTTQATNIKNAINASTNLAGIVTATSALGVVTITAFTSGIMGNGLQISAGNTSNMTAVGFAGGSNGTKVILA